ncbi:hypothetical protein ABZ721_29805 [Streptomyces sp. NPDC006733]|uniref:hypothetical protein n=1 Tax=Streptomyces sp. NPDC006733 TaxID=3155460 RepID=UPI0033D92E32
MTRNLPEVDRDLKTAESDISSLRNSLSTLTTRVDGLHTSEKKTVSHLKENSKDIEKLNEKAKWIRYMLVGTVLTGQFLKVDPSIVKIDEKGLSILGAARPWPAKFTGKVKKIEEFMRTAKEKRDAEDKKLAAAAAKRNLDNAFEAIAKHDTEINELKRVRQESAESLKRAQQNKNNQLTAGSDTQRRNAKGRGADTENPSARGVAGDVKMLRGAIEELIKTLGGV